MGVRYNVKIPTDGLMLYLDASNPQSNRGDPSTWYDISGNNRHASLINGMVAGIIGGRPAMLSSDTLSSYASVPHDAEISRRVFGAQLVGTLCSWFYVTEAVDWAPLLNKAIGSSYSSATLGLWSWTSGHSVLVGTNVPSNPSGSQLRLTSPLLINQWVHLVGVFEGDRAKAYLNGVKFADSPINESISLPRGENSAPITIGRRRANTSPSLNGGVGMVSVYDRFLSDDEVDVLFQTQRRHYGI